MSKSNKINIPSSMGGIVRYYDEFKSKIELTPVTVVIMIVVVILVEIFLHMRGI